MSTDGDLLLLILFLFYYMKDFILSLVKVNEANIIEAFNLFTTLWAYSADDK